MDIAAALNVQNFFAHGIALSPWALTISDRGGARRCDSEASQARAAHFRSLRSISRLRRMRGVSLVGPAVLSITGPQADLSRQLNNAFALRSTGRRCTGNGPVRIAIDNTILDATSLLRAQTPGRW